MEKTEKSIYVIGAIIIIIMIVVFSFKLNEITKCDSINKEGYLFIDYGDWTDEECFDWVNYEKKVILITGKVMSEVSEEDVNCFAGYLDTQNININEKGTYNIEHHSGSVYLNDVGEIIDCSQSGSNSNGGKN